MEIKVFFFAREQKKIFFIENELFKENVMWERRNLIIQYCLMCSFNLFIILNIRFYCDCNSSLYGTLINAQI